MKTGWTYSPTKRGEFNFVVKDAEGKVMAWTKERLAAERIIRAVNDFDDFVEGTKFLYSVNR